MVCGARGGWIQLKCFAALGPGRALGDAEEPFEFCRDGKSSNGAVCCDALCDTCGEIGCKKQLLCTAAPAASAFGGSA